MSSNWEGSTGNNAYLFWYSVDLLQLSTDLRLSSLDPPQDQRASSLLNLQWEGLDLTVSPWELTIMKRQLTFVNTETGNRFIVFPLCVHIHGQGWKRDELLIFVNFVCNTLSNICLFSVPLVLSGMFSFFWDFNLILFNFPPIFVFYGMQCRHARLKMIFNLLYQFPHSLFPWPATVLPLHWGNSYLLWFIRTKMRSSFTSVFLFLLKHPYMACINDIYHFHTCRIIFIFLPPYLHSMSQVCNTSHWFLSFMQWMAQGSGQTGWSAPVLTIWLLTDIRTADTGQTFSPKTTKMKSGTWKLFSLVDEVDVFGLALPLASSQ